MRNQLCDLILTRLYQFICSAGPKSASPAIHKGLTSSQAPVEEFEVESKDGRTVSLVDTPGFNDTERSDRMILDEIIRFLKSRSVSFVDPPASRVTL